MMSRRLRSVIPFEVTLVLYGMEVGTSGYHESVLVRIFNKQLIRDGFVGYITTHTDIIQSVCMEQGGDNLLGQHVIDIRCASDTYLFACYHGADGAVSEEHHGSAAYHMAQLQARGD